MITISIKICSDEYYDTSEKHVNLFKEVNWSYVPNIGQTIFVGLNDEDMECTINAKVSRINFCSDGYIEVCCFIKYLQEEYNNVLDSLVRDGFVNKL